VRSPRAAALFGDHAFLGERLDELDEAARIFTVALPWT